MKKVMKKLLPALLAFALMSGSALAQARIATINLQKVFEKYWRTEQVTAALKDRVAELEKTHKELLDGWKKSKEEYQQLVEDSNNQAVSGAERDRRKKAAEEKFKDLKASEDNITQFERQASVTIGEQKTRLRKNLLDEIKLTIESKAKAANYTLVLDTGSQSYAADPTGPYYTPNVLYWTESGDLTDAVISQLNVGAPLNMPATDEKPAPPPKAKK